MANDPTITLSEQWVKEFLQRPILARLGTANPQNNQPHVTPVWFEWDGEYVYISAFMNTRKGREVQKNARISVLVDVNEPTEAVLFEGIAEILEDPKVVIPRSESIYARYVGISEIKKDPYAGWAADKENRIIRLKPEKAFTWRF